MSTTYVIIIWDVCDREHVHNKIHVLYTFISFIFINAYLDDKAFLTPPPGTTVLHYKV